MKENTSRKAQLWAIILLTAITMMPQYALQGWLALGGAPIQEDMFWQSLSKIDPFAWSVRALVEAWVLVYLFSSDAKTDQDKQWLTRFEIALIALITFTLGPALVAIGQEKAMRDALSFAPLYWAWAFAIASYAPLMLGAVGFAFRLEKSQATASQQKHTKVQSKSTEQKYETQGDSVKQKQSKRKRANKQKQIAEIPCDACGRTFATIQALSAHKRFCGPELDTNENVVKDTVAIDQANGRHN